MRRSITSIIIIFFSFNVLGQISINGLHCGTRGSFLGILASDFLIPDYFPPENPLLRFLLVNPFLINLGECEKNYEPVHLGEACMAHDACYGTLGANKDTCDEALMTNWASACDKHYANKGEMSKKCAHACHTVAELMHTAMSYDDGIFCPSCIAFERDQEMARKKNLK
jgi:hypothetical protein